MLDQRLRLARVVTLVDAVDGRRDARPLRRGSAAGRDRRRAGRSRRPTSRRSATRCASASTRSTPAPSASSAPPRATRPRCCLRRKAPTPTLPRERGRGSDAAAATHPPPLAGDGWGAEATLAGAEAPTPTASPPSRSILDGAVSRLDFARALGGLAQDRGNDLLRVKGIVALRRPPGPAGGRAGGAARDVHAGMARRLARCRTSAAASSLSSTTSRPTKSSRVSPSPRRALGSAHPPALQRSMHE